MDGATGLAERQARRVFRKDAEHNSLGAQGIALKSTRATGMTLATNERMLAEAKRATKYGVFAADLTVNE